MARYTTQKEFLFPLAQVKANLVPDPTASLVIEFWNGASWTADSVSPITAPTSFNVAGLKMRITPTGGGYFVNDEGIDI